MANLSLSEFEQQKPTIQMAPLIDIVFLTLIFFMTLSVFYQLESELSISVPSAKQSKEAARSPGEIIINIKESGQVIVNQRELNYRSLEKMLMKVAALFPNQPVIIRADKQTYHKYIVKVLDSCAAANIWNISFATTTQEN